MKYINTILLALLLFSCNGQRESKETSLKKGKDFTKSVHIKEQVNKELFDYELVGLACNEEEDNDDFYKKYYLELEALCYGGTPGFFINTKQQKIYAFDYIIGQGCKNEVPQSNSIVYTFEIDSINNKNLKCSFYTSIALNKKANTKSSRNILFIFSKYKKEIYELKIYEDGKELQNEFITRYRYYVNENYRDKFVSEECGDFEG